MSPSTPKAMQAEINQAIKDAIAAHLASQANAIRFREERLDNIGSLHAADLDWLLEDIAERLDLGAEAFHDELKIDYDAQPIDTVGELQDRIFAAIQKGAS